MVPNDEIISIMNKPKTIIAKQVSTCYTDFMTFGSLFRGNTILKSLMMFLFRLSHFKCTSSFGPLTLK